MAVPANYRWIAVGSLLVRNRQNAPVDAPEFSIDDLFDAITDRADSERRYRYYNLETRLMWCEHFDDDDDYYYFLIQTGDKNVAGLSLIDFESKESRDLNKNDDEGGHYTAHVLIRREPEANGRHAMFVEKVPGIYLGAVKDHFAWACNDAAYQKEAPGPDGENRSYRAIFEIDGFQSRTIREALATGELRDIEFVSYEERDGDGHDEADIVDEVVREARWKVGKRVSEEQAEGLFARAWEFLDDWASEIDEAQMLVRIKTESGQIKRTEINEDAGNALEQAFVQNEVIRDFEDRLPPKYVELHGEVMEKMRQIGVQVGV